MTHSTLFHHRFASLGAPLLIALFALALTGCGTPQLKPAPAANRLSGEAVGARASARQVHVEAAVEAWNGRPEDIEKLEPVLVTVRNRSDQPLRIRYDAFQLVSAAGATFNALAPLSIDKEASVSVRNFSPYYGSGYSGFSVAPNWGGYYGGYGVGTYSGFGYAPAYYDRYDLKEIDLPTDDMLERALPEGVIEPGGKARGFLYFERLNDNVKRASLKTELVNARTGEQFGAVMLPFKVS